MKKLYALLLFMFAFALSANATQLVGTLLKPDGTGFTGTLYLSIAQQVGISSGGSCGGPVLVVPTVNLPVTITNGTMQSAPNVYGGECTLPQGMPYNAILKDTNGNVMFSTQWLITGATQDVGTVYQGPSPLPPTAFVAVYGIGSPVALNLNPCSAQTMYVQTDAAAGSNLWPCINNVYTQQGGSGSSGLSINAPVNGGYSTGAILFESTLGLLAQDTPFTYSVSTHTLNSQNLAVSGVMTGTLNGNASTATALASVPGKCSSTQATTGVDIHGNALGCFTPGGSSLPMASSAIANGQSTVTAMNVAGSYATVVAESYTTATDLPLMGWQTNQRYGITSSMPTSFRLFDNRNRQLDDYCYNTSITSTTGTCHFFNTLNDKRDSTVAGHAPVPHSNFVLTTTDVAPGMYDTGQWSSSKAFTINQVVFGKGIDQPSNIAFTKWGVGDWADYHYFSYASGSPEGDDEGGTGMSIQLRENGGGTNETTGTISSIGTGTFGVANTSAVIVLKTGAYPGDGRPAVLTKDASGNDAAWLTSTATSVDSATYTTPAVFGRPGTIVTPASVIESTAWGTATAQVFVPANLDIPQSVTFNVVIAGGTSAGYTSNAYACMVGGTHFEQVYITNVTGAAGLGNTQTVTANLRQNMVVDQASGSNPQLWQDSNLICGSYATLDASVRTTGATPIRQFVPLLGASDTHTLRYAFPARGSNRTMMATQNEDAFPNIAPVSFTSSGSVGTAVVTFPTTAQYKDWSNRAGIVVTGTTDFNGTYTFLPTTTPGTYTFTFGGGTFGTPETGTATSDRGRNTLRVYYGSEIINVSNPDLTDPVWGRYIEFAPNNIPWIVGGTLDFPMFPYMPISSTFNSAFMYSSLATGEQNGYQGPGVSSYSFIGKTITNLNENSPARVGIYRHFGGTLDFPQAALHIEGPWANGIEFLNAIVPGGNVFSLGCPIDSINSTHACAGADDAYTIIAFGTKNANGASEDYQRLIANVPNDSLDLNIYPYAFSFGRNGWKMGTDYNRSPLVAGLYSLLTDPSTVHVGSSANLKLDAGNILTISGHGISIGGSQVLTTVIGSTGTEIPAATGTFVSGNLISKDANLNDINSGIAVTSVCLSTGVHCPASGTLPVTITAVAHNFLTSYNAATGAFTAAQPSYSDISGTSLPSSVLGSSLTSLGTLSSLTVSGAASVGTITSKTYSSSSGVTSSSTCVTGHVCDAHSGTYVLTTTGGPPPTVETFFGTLVTFNTPYTSIPNCTYTVTDTTATSDIVYYFLTATTSELDFQGADSNSATYYVAYVCGGGN